MIPESQRRILARLAQFGDEMQEAWDVPRELSLPGLAESLGVVRSALHIPLSSMEEDGLITTRTAHVIGGGSRRRTVVHITEAGRSSLSENEPQSATRRGRSYGPLPEKSILHGRDEASEDLATILTGGTSVLLSGLPGVGKSSLAREVAEQIMTSGWTVRWASCSIDADASAIGEMWLDESLTDASAIATSASSKRTLLVIDEAQELHPRHSQGVAELIGHVSSRESPILVVVRSPSPFGVPEGLSEIKLDGLRPQHAMAILPSDLDESEALGVAEKLAGHPLALHLWSPGEKLPERVEAVQQFVESTVMRRLSEDGMSTLDELCLSPTPLAIEELFEELGTLELDEAAILRWTGTIAEPHHLIRNVRRGSWSPDEAKSLHSKAAVLWATRDGARARRIQGHHMINAGEMDADWMSENIGDIADEDSAAAAVVLEQAVKISDSQLVREAAADLALDRGEVSIAENHISELIPGASSKMRMARVARMRGDMETALELESSAMSEMAPDERAKATISTLVRLHDDRLPGRVPESLSDQLILLADSIDLSDLPESQRAAGNLSIELVRHSIALDSGDLAEAARARTSIESRIGEDDNAITLLNLRSRLSSQTDGSTSPEAINAARKAIESCEGIYRIRLIHTTLESMNEYPEWLAEAHSSIIDFRLRDDLPMQRRLCAQRWYWRGVLEPINRLSHWNEAVSRFRMAECSSAANQLISMIAREI
tara:strand:+ start:13155 stop:15317 length:2163 start_codon:yes stop_codon:yes gene_type:complete